MSNNIRTFALVVTSFFIWPFGIILFFTHKDEQEAQIFGILAIIGFLLTTGFFLRDII